MCSQSYGFISSHVQMWETDHKEGGMPKKWCLRIVVLEKLESPLNSKEIIKPVNPKGNQPWVFIGKTMLKLKFQYFTLRHATTKIERWTFHAKWKKPVTKTHIQHGSTYTKSLEQANLQKQKDQWLPRTKRSEVWWDVPADGHNISFLRWWQRQWGDNNLKLIWQCVQFCQHTKKLLYTKWLRCLVCKLYVCLQNLFLKNIY